MHLQDVSKMFHDELIDAMEHAASSKLFFSFFLSPVFLAGSRPNVSTVRKHVVSSKKEFIAVDEKNTMNFEAGEIAINTSPTLK